MSKDIDFNFAVHPLTGDLSIKKNSNAIKQSMKNLVMTSYYERGFNIIGGNVRSSLFENIGPLEIQTLKDMIIEVIENYEPRVEVSDVQVAYGDDENTILAQVIYTENNDPTDRTFEIELERLR